jgi:hypothetical protein
MMKRLGIIVLNFILVCSFHYCNAQSVDKKKFSALISLNENYKLNVAEVYPHSYGEIYLITGNQDIDSTMLALSKDKYYSQRSIIDSIKRKFNLYLPVRAKATDSALDELFIDLTNPNNYTKDYMFELDGTYQKQMPGAIPRFNILLRWTPNFKFSKVDKKCNPSKKDCTVLVKKSS